LTLFADRDRAAPVVARLPAHQPVDVVVHRGPWTFVQADDGREGWVADLEGAGSLISRSVSQPTFSARRLAIALAACVLVLLLGAAVLARTLVVGDNRQASQLPPGTPATETSSAAPAAISTTGTATAETVMPVGTEASVLSTEGATSVSMPLEEDFTQKWMDLRAVRRTAEADQLTQDAVTRHVLVDLPVGTRVRVIAVGRPVTFGSVRWGHRRVQVLDGNATGQQGWLLATDLI
jgi:hypothetical protein